ncbi:CaiB/BaiF CoA transferase family protein [Blastococcus xanthinilyticus]|uniref:Crotonobetainyl-CoA:carnitine CoA-transferase CaiB-like acyl-CoA transferase n=1 Tax=Blastococcus xanthinilyticus TaxID=1564164 RepID=A0A5S5D7P5_9ACTN|nr:CoA transferase [Blastococcus xanthinilyticus]TYP90772.1 crotonobetainyl-CoA:carnitine CoA-transferase CaiB-like acyl-CoA transferase [Blastococcus xanthinilyticus]
MTALLLDGVRVLDLSTMIAAPTTATILGDYGADVVKVEMPGTGDFVRRFGRQVDGQGLYWKTLSRGKRSVALDLRRPEGRDLVLRWIGQFDVLVENFRPGTLERWGLAPADLRAVNPRLVVLRVTAYGQDGPYRDRPGFGTLAEALAGLASVAGYDDRPPLLPAYPLADIMAGNLGATAVLAALMRRQATGTGDTIDLAIYEAALKLVEINVLEYQQTGAEHGRTGNRYGPAAPRGSYQCRDGLWIALSGSTQPMAQHVLRTIGGEELVVDPRFATNADRVQHVQELDDLIAAWCRTRDRDDAIAELTAGGCAVGPLESVATMLDNPQVRHRGSIVTVDDPDLGPLAMTGAYPSFSDGGTRIGRPGPADVGADTDAVLAADLGLAADELAALRAAGVTAGPAAVPPEEPQDAL